MDVKLLPGNDERIELALDEIRELEDVGFIDGDLPVRPIDKNHVEQLAASGLTGIPPLEVVKTASGYGLIDGRHRREAARVLKRAKILVHVGTYANEDAVIEAAFRANLTHGLKASMEDRIAYARWLYDNFDLSQADMAKKLGVSQPTVSRIIRTFEKQDDEEQQVTSTARNDEEREYNLVQADYAKKLQKALEKFFENERAFFSLNATGKRNEDKRARVLVAIAGDDKEQAEMYESLARSFVQAANMIRLKNR